MDYFILLCGSQFSCVARMGVLHQNYRTFPGWARGDLEATIYAGLAALRGRRHGVADSSVEVISEPITARYRLDLIHSTLSERMPGPLGNDVLFRDVEVEWNKIKGAFADICFCHRGGDVIQCAYDGVEAWLHRDCQDAWKTAYVIGQLG
jgi:hypothetical protein